MKIIDKTDGLRPYTGDSYIFMLVYANGEEKTLKSQTKLAYKKHIDKDVKSITIDLL